VRPLNCGCVKDILAMIGDCNRSTSSAKCGIIARSHIGYPFPPDGAVFPHPNLRRQFSGPPRRLPSACHDIVWAIRNVLLTTTGTDTPSPASEVSMFSHRTALLLLLTGLLAGRASAADQEQYLRFTSWQAFLSSGERLYTVRCVAPELAKCIRDYEARGYVRILRPTTRMMMR
jgi:hypothetical protein